MTTSMTTVVLPGVSFPLEASGNPPCKAEVTDAALTLTSGPSSDLFIDPAGEEGARPDAGRLTGLPGDLDFTLTARVSVGFGSVSDAGVLLLYLSERRWAKLCYELSPRGRPTAVTVVTHSLSDDSRSFETAGGPLWLSMTRSGRAWAFYASEDGSTWQRVRYFSLGESSGARVGFMVQSPEGTGCTAVFDNIVYQSGEVTRSLEQGQEAPAAEEERVPHPRHEAERQDLGEQAAEDGAEGGPDTADLIHSAAPGHGGLGHAEFCARGHLARQGDGRAIGEVPVGVGLTAAMLTALRAVRDRREGAGGVLSRKVGAPVDDRGHGEHRQTEKDDGPQDEYHQSLQISHTGNLRYVAICSQSNTFSFVWRLVLVC